jgi:hypothetical protein
MAVLCTAEAQEGRKPADGDDSVRDPRIPELHARLVEAVRKLNLRAAGGSEIVVTLESGACFDPIDLVWLVVRRTAKFAMAQDRITSIEFGYYQFNMSNTVREEKSISTATPGSEDLRPVNITYSASTGEKYGYTLGDLRKVDSRRSVATQYHANYLARVLLLEQYNSGNIRKESLRIEQTIQLGN